MQPEAPPLPLAPLSPAPDHPLSVLVMDIVSGRLVTKFGIPVFAMQMSPPAVHGQ